MRDIRAGFAIVLVDRTDRGENGLRLNPEYEGIGGLPAFPSEYEQESEPLWTYYFSGAISDESNLTPDAETAFRLLSGFSNSPRKFDVLYCCNDANEECYRTLGLKYSLQPLGYDVAMVSSDGWSIVDDFCPSEWADDYARLLNEHGHFCKRSEAERYLSEYRARQEYDHDYQFDVVFVSRVVATTF